MTRSVAEKQAGLPPRAQAALGGPPLAEPGPVCRAGCVQILKREEEAGGSDRGSGEHPSGQPGALLGGGVRREGDRPRVRCHTGLAQEAGSHRWGSHGPPGPARSSEKRERMLCSLLSLTFLSTTQNFIFGASWWAPPNFW